MRVQCPNCLAENQITQPSQPDVVYRCHKCSFDMTWWVQASNGTGKKDNTPKATPKITVPNNTPNPQSNDNVILECPKCGREYATVLRLGKEYRCPQCRWFLRPAKGQSFRCSSCGRKRYLKSIPTTDLCQSCAAKKRAAQNIPVSITDKIVVTTNIAKRLGSQAKIDAQAEAFKAASDIPKTEGEIIGEKLQLSWRWFLLSLATGFPVAGVVSTAREDSSLFWLVLLAWGLGLPVLLSAIGEHLMAGGNSPLRREVYDRQFTATTKARTVELAEERRRRQEEEETFYSSPEWAQLRALVIKEEGQVCAECHKRIKNDEDVTVDHIRPRSKYPDLALRRENLRVLCRSCNSAKSDKDMIDS